MRTDSVCQIAKNRNLNTKTEGKYVGITGFNNINIYTRHNQKRDIGLQQAIFPSSDTISVCCVISPLEKGLDNKLIAIWKKQLRPKSKHRSTLEMKKCFLCLFWFRNCLGKGKDRL